MGDWADDGDSGEKTDWNLDGTIVCGGLRLQSVARNRAVIG